jgi:hypothetical protein
LERKIIPLSRQRIANIAWDPPGSMVIVALIRIFSEVILRARFSSAESDPLDRRKRCTIGGFAQRRQFIRP